MRRTQRNPDMVAEQSSQPRPRDQPASQFSTVCADEPDVCNAEQIDDLFYVEFRADAPCQRSTVAVQVGVQHGQDGRRQQGADSEMQVEQNSVGFSQVSGQ